MRSPGMTLILCCTAAFCALACWLVIMITPATAAPPLPIAADAPPVNSAIGGQSHPVTTTLHLPFVAGPPPAKVVIAAAHIDSSVSYEPDEAILLWNAGYQPQPLAGWTLVAGSRRATFPITTTLTLAGGERIWCTAEADAFRMTFGHSPSCVWHDPGSQPTDRPLRLDGQLQFNNRGGTIQLLDADGKRADLLLYGEEGETFDDWHGSPVQPYDRGVISKAGQILARKQHPDTLQPLDNDESADWQSDLADMEWGRRVRYPGWRGWSAADGALPATGHAQAVVTVAIGPEGLYPTLAGALDDAQERIDLSIYTLEHPELTDVLVAATERGVALRLLLEGSPPGGISDLQKWCVARLAAAGADVRYLAPQAETPNGLRPRYSYAHAKYGLIDGHMALIGTDNFNRDSMPVQHQNGGRRGIYLMTDAPPVVTELTRIFAEDWAPQFFADLHPFEPDHARYGGPPSDFVLHEAPSYPTADAAFQTATSYFAGAHFSVVSAPENALRPDAGLLALLAQAGPGDEILDQQLYEHKYWGDSDSNPIADPNPRLQAMIDAARRGARVRILLDSFFDNDAALRSNRATADYIAAVATAEGIDIAARLGNPTGGGIHAKMVLVRVDDTTWSAVGSLNGSEVSHKLNREIVLLTDMTPIHTRLTELFDHDWRLSADN